MPAHKTRLFAVIYTPYYRLQCARQKRLHALPEAVNASNQLELSIEKPMLDCPVSLSAKVEEEKPVALLDTEGSRIIEVNPVAAAAGIEIGVTTSLALARTSELQLFAPAAELEHQQQSALLQLCYRYSPYLENTAAGVCTLDLQGRKDHHPEWWARELLAQWRIPSNPGQNQFDLFQSGLKDPNRFFQTLARLAALLGNDQVGIPEKLNTHKPDSVRLRMPTFDWSGTDQVENKHLRIGVPLRRYRPTIPVEVQLNEEKPTWICGHNVTGQVRVARGPWRTSGNWWNADRWDMQEWDVELEDGTLYRLALNAGRWVIVGVYD
jgi:hypothetical protein